MKLSSLTQQEAKTVALSVDMKAPAGEVYEIAVPDTLDLSQRAAISLNALSGILEPRMNYEFLWIFRFNQRPMSATPDDRSFSACGPKILESFAMMTLMSGSDRYRQGFNGLKNLLVSWIDDDGIQYCKVGPERPWDTVCPEDWANIAQQGRMMLAMMAIYQMDKNPAWLTLTQNMSDGLVRAAVDKGEYAYYPSNIGNEKIKMGEGFCFTRSGYYNSNEAAKEAEGREGSMFAYVGTVIRALTRWYTMSGDKKAIKMAGKLVKYVMRGKYWGAEYGWGPDTTTPYIGHSVQIFKIVGPEHGFFTGHFHGHTIMLYALIEYANAVNDYHLKQFVRSSYEYARGQGIARIGLFGEPCTISDMLATAIKLSEGGVGDYWDDVDGYIRNQMIEQQLINPDHMANIGSDKKVSKDDLGLIERCVGVYSGTDLGQNSVGYSIQCCTGNGTQALYYAWEGAVREKAKGRVEVNLLLNRVSPCMDVLSYLPYEGKVVLRNKTAKSLSLRVPGWADRRELACTVNGKKRQAAWSGNHVLLDGLKGRDEIVVTFPMEEESVTYTVLTGQQWTDDTRPVYNPPNSYVRYTCLFKGNTLVDLSPRPKEPYYPTYERDRYKSGKAPMKKVRVYLSPDVIKW